MADYSESTSGVVERIMEFPKSNGTFYSFVVQDQMYGLGKVKPTFNKGDSVSFDYTQSGKYLNADPKSVRVESGNKRPVPVTEVASTKSNSAGFDSRQDSIIFQSSRKDALHIVDIMASNGLLPFGKARTAVTKAELVELFVKEYTTHFFQEAKDLGGDSGGTTVVAAICGKGGDDDGEVNPKAERAAKTRAKSRKAVEDDDDEDFDDDLPF